MEGGHYQEEGPGKRKWREGSSLRGGSELHSFCGDRVTGARDVPSVPAGPREQRP